MKSINIKIRFAVIKKISISAVFIMILYFIGSLYFSKHFLFNTAINGVNVSLKSHEDAERIINNYINDYELHIINKDGGAEVISASDINMKFNNTDIFVVGKIQNSFKWISSLFKRSKYYINGLYTFDSNSLRNEINALNCLNKDIIEPQNVKFIYSNGSYEIKEAVYGNKINDDKINKAIRMSILQGKSVLDLVKTKCYEVPKYTLASEKTLETGNLLNKYVATRVTYLFGSDKEILDGNMIKEWLSVDDNLDVKINKLAVTNYVIGLEIKYNTVGITRSFKTSFGKIVEVKGGIYGWKINRKAEVKALLENIFQSEVIEKEPSYSQKAFIHDKNDIGNTYVEINITKQHLWFYKDGKLIAQGSVVTGNPNNGNATVLGTHMINYKETGSTLSGLNYDVKVTYWMPFYGNIGIHDANWRNSFGGEIYKRNGTHGCVNAPFYLAKTIFENIEEGTPVICYEEE